MVEGGATRYTLYDGQTPLLDFNGSGTVTARYLDGPAVDQVLARETTGGVVAWYLADRLGTVRDIVNNSGTVIDHVDYGVYGIVTAESSPANGDRFKYAGMQYDATTQVYFDQARWYDPNGGKFISEDPIGFGGRDANVDRYVGNGPTNATDPTGMADFVLGGANYVWPWNWSPSWSGVGTTIGNYGQTIAVTAAAGAGGAATGSLSGTAGGAVGGGLVTGGPGILPGAAGGFAAGGTWGGFTGAIDAFFNSPPGTTWSQALQTGEDKGWIPGLAGGMMGGMSKAACAPSVPKAPSAPNAEPVAEDFFAGTRYTEKVQTQMKLGDNHSFPELVKNWQGTGTMSKVTGGDGISRDLLRIPGSYKGRDGVFEFMKEPNGCINHRFFKANKR